MEICLVVGCYEFSFLVFFGEFLVVSGSACSAVPVAPEFAVGSESADDELEGPCVSFLEFERGVFYSCPHYFCVETSPCYE